MLVGSSTGDDAGVYRISDELALVHTVDFFTPIVDDPYLFGQISAANSVSDIYAMGAEPISALNMLCFPEKQLDEEGMRLILQGGADKMREAGVVILGGHSIKDNELKYGLAVTGKIHPDKIIENNGLRPGDRLLLTKPIGTGILSTALKNDQLNGSDLDEIITSMLTLNRIPSQVMQKYDVSACTDITGFGLVGHIHEMVQRKNVDVVLQMERIPVFEKAREFAEQTVNIPGGTISNYKFCEDCFDAGAVESWNMSLLFDPQTSGGLCIAVSEKDSKLFPKAVKGYPFPIVEIGRVQPGSGKIIIR